MRARKGKYIIIIKKIFHKITKAKLEREKRHEKTIVARTTTIIFFFF